MVDINLTRDASAHLCIAEAVELRDQDRLRLEERSTLALFFAELGAQKRHTSTKLAVFPSSSTPRVLKRVPARFAPKREIRLSVAMVGVPFVGGAGSGIVNTPT